MDVIVEKVLVDLLLVAAQLAIVRLLAWLNGRRAAGEAPTVALPAAA